MTSSEQSILIKMLQGMNTDEQKDAGTSVPDYIKEPAEQIEKLRKRKAALEIENKFAVGDIIVWKDGLKNKRVPEYGRPCIVLSIHNPALEDDGELSFIERFDIEIGFISNEDEFLTFNYEGKRFRKFDDKI